MNILEPLESKKLKKIIHICYGLKINILLVDCDRLLFDKKYKNFKILKKINILDKRSNHLTFELLKFRLRNSWGIL